MLSYKTKRLLTLAALFIVAMRSIALTTFGSVLQVAWLKFTLDLNLWPNTTSDQSVLISLTFFFTDKN